MWFPCWKCALCTLLPQSCSIVSVVSKTKCLWGWNYRRMSKNVSFKTGCAAVQVRSDVAENLGLKGSPLREAPPGDAQSIRKRFMLRRCQVLLPFDRQNLRYGVIQRTLEHGRKQRCGHAKNHEGDVFFWYFLNCLLSLLEIVPCSSMSTVETGLQRSETRSKTMWSILGGEKIASTHNQPMQCLGKWRALLNCFRTSFLVEGCWRGSCIWMGIRTNHIMWAYRAYPNICWGLDHFDFIPATGQQWHHLLPAAERLRGFAVKTWVGIWKMLLNVSTRVYPANCFSMFQAILTIAYKCIQLLLMFNAPHLLLFVGMNPRQYPSAVTKSCFQLLLRFWNVLTLSTEEHVAELLQDIWLMASTKHYSYGATASHPSRYGMIINSEWYRIAKLKASLHLFYFADSEVASCC